MTTTKEIGRQYESEAASYFERKGWQLLARNFSCKLGEVDLIFRDPAGTVVFVEVKFRSRNDFGFGQECVGYKKQAKMAKAALAYIKEKRLSGNPFRFDIASVTPENLEHIPNAFSPEGYTL